MKTISSCHLMDTLAEKKINFSVSPEWRHIAILPIKKAIPS